MDICGHRRCMHLAVANHRRSAIVVNGDFAAVQPGMKRLVGIRRE